MKYTIIIFIIFFNLPALSVTQQGAFQELSSFGLNKRAASTLKKKNPRFRPFTRSEYITSVRELFQRISKPKDKRHPSLIAGDFTGDQIEDMALRGADGANEYVYLLIKTKKGYAVITVSKTKYTGPPKQRLVHAGVKTRPESGLNIYLSKNISKNIPIQNKAVFAPRDFLQIETYLGATFSYYYSKGKMHRYLGQPL